MQQDFILLYSYKKVFGLKMMEPHFFLVGLFSFRKSRGLEIFPSTGRINSPFLLCLSSVTPSLTFFYRGLSVKTTDYLRILSWSHISHQTTPPPPPPPQKNNHRGSQKKHIFLIKLTPWRKISTKTKQGSWLITSLYFQLFQSQVKSFRCLDLLEFVWNTNDFIFFMKK